MSKLKVKQGIIDEIEEIATTRGKIRVIIKDYDSSINKTSPGDEIDTAEIKKYIKAYFDAGCFKKQQEEREQKQIDRRASKKTFTTDIRDAPTQSFDSLMGEWRSKGFIKLEEGKNILINEEGITISKIIDKTFKSKSVEKKIKKDEKKKVEDIESIVEEFVSNGVKQIILTGAPGTGKTYNARKLAIKLILEEQYNEYLSMNENQKNQVEDILAGNSVHEYEVDKHISFKYNKFKGNLAFVQFHPSYDYTDFVEGIRPKKDTSNQGIGFEYKPGIFMEFCYKAAENKTKHILIIDEINRADLSKVFGELMFGLESDYRGKIIKTQYENLREEGKAFFIPENIYIIGTMNDIDRSVSTFDFALRRRFAWLEIKTNDVMDSALKSMLKDYENVDALIEDATLLNDTISSSGKDLGLNDSYQLGPAYFAKIDTSKDLDYSQSKKKLWNYHLKPILKEYVRGYDSDRVESFILDCFSSFN